VGWVNPAGFIPFTHVNFEIITPAKRRPCIRIQSSAVDAISTELKIIVFRGSFFRASSGYITGGREMQPGIVQQEQWWAAQGRSGMGVRLTRNRAFAIVSKRLEVIPLIWPCERSRIAWEISLSDSNVLVHPRVLPPQQSGELIHLPRQDAQWEWMSFFVRRLQPNDVFRSRTEHEEAAFVLLGGTCFADWGQGSVRIGKRKNVFDGLPYVLYLSTGHTVTFTGETVCEIAECRVPSDMRAEAKLVTPKDVVSSIRGGGNVSRQIVDAITPAFPADRLMVIEVYTPGGNWSSYPPHKHDVHNPPAEVDLDEIYYYRIRQPDGFALQHLYSGDRSAERTVKTRDGDAVLVRSGYHPVVAGPGYDIYYLNFLAGSARVLAVTEDAQHVWIRSTWHETDPRLPLVKG
jgi:5-deoxy-glucuronate isomerase